jgi:hypothetical protein
MTIINEATFPRTGATQPGAARRFGVYFSGVASIASHSIPAEEEAFLAALQARLPELTLVRSVYPYSTNGPSLARKHLLSGLWQSIERYRRSHPVNAFTQLVNLRNILLVTSTAIPPLSAGFSRRLADVIVYRLAAAGYPSATGDPICLLGLSGGCQMGLAVAGRLRLALAAPLDLISVGGVFNSHPGLNAVRRLYHLYGSRDPVHRLGHTCSPARLSGWPSSHWARAVREGRVSLLPVGPHTHRGAGNYVDALTCLPDGRPYAQPVLDAITAIVRG